nr:hypothetical protein [Tanacetum cinerariifolium]
YSYKLSPLVTVAMSADSAVTYTSIHTEARSWSITYEDPYEEAAQQLFEQAPRSPEARILEADTPPLSRPLLATPRPGCEVGESSVAAARRQGPTIAHGVNCSYMETRLQDTEKRMMAALELVNRRVSYQVEVCTREISEFCTRHYDAQKDRAAVRAEIEVLRNERLTYEQEGIQTRKALARSEAHCRALEALEAGAHIDTLEDTGSSS